jgi:type VI secretion system protein ImpA
VFGVPEPDQVIGGDGSGRAHVASTQSEAPVPALETAVGVLDPTATALCAPISEADPCGPDLDSEADSDYLNFFAQVTGILPTSFFSPEDGRPFDPATIDIKRQLDAIKPLLAQSRDVRLLTVQARLLILNRDLAGFSMTIAVIAQLHDKFWDTLHPRPLNGDLDGRLAAIATLELPTVVFALQYAPLFEGRRTGSISYRRWMIATGEAKPRSGEAELAIASITEAIDQAGPAVLAAPRKHIALLKVSLDRIRAAFAAHGNSAGLETLTGLVGKILALIDPYAATAAGEINAATSSSDDQRDVAATDKAAGPVLTSIVDAAHALAAIADYYSHAEPSSPALPLVRQAHQLIGKSFLEVMTILMPSQVEQAAFQIGTDAVFDLPLSKLPRLSEVASGVPSVANNAGEPADSMQQHTEAEQQRYRVESRSQAIALLDLVQRYFRFSEPSSPVPMLCDRARALAERDFMGVLRDVLPKSALKNINTDK